MSIQKKKSKRGHLRYLFEIQNKIYYCHQVHTKFDKLDGI